MCRKILLIFASLLGVIYSNDFELYFSVILTIVSYVLHVWHMPYETPELNLLESISLLSSEIVNFAGMYFKLINRTAGMDIVMIIFGMMGNAFFFIAFLKEFIRIKLKDIRRNPTALKIINFVRLKLCCCMKDAKIWKTLGIGVGASGFAAHFAGQLQMMNFNSNEDEKKLVTSPDKTPKGKPDAIDIGSISTPRNNEDLILSPDRTPVGGLLSKDDERSPSLVINQASQSDMKLLFDKTNTNTNLASPTNKKAIPRFSMSQCLDQVNEEDRFAKSPLADSPTYNPKRSQLSPRNRHIAPPNISMTKSEEEINENGIHLEIPKTPINNSSANQIKNNPFSPTNQQKPPLLSLSKCLDQDNLMPKSPMAGTSTNQHKPTILSLSKCFDQDNLLSKSPIAGSPTQTNIKKDLNQITEEEDKSPMTGSPSNYNKNNSLQSRNRQMAPPETPHISMSECLDQIDEEKSQSKTPTNGAQTKTPKNIEPTTPYSPTKNRATMLSLGDILQHVPATPTNKTQLREPIPEDQGNSATSGASIILSSDASPMERNQVAWATNQPSHGEKSPMKGHQVGWESQQQSPENGTPMIRSVEDIFEEK